MIQCRANARGGCLKNSEVDSAVSEYKSASTVVYMCVCEMECSDRSLLGAGRRTHASGIRVNSGESEFS